MQASDVKQARRRRLTAVLPAAALLAAVLLAGPLAPPPGALAEQTAPEAATGLAATQQATAREQIAVTANPLASDAALAILRQGGSAADAAIAALLVLGLVEPQSSGLGGGAFWLQYEADGTLSAYDGREAAPASATPELFLDAQGQPLDFWTAVASGRSVGVPGLVRLLALAHAQHGRLPWAALFQPAIALAEQGFAISPRLAALVAEDELLPLDPVAKAYFYQPDGTPKTAGTRLANPDYAAMLRQLAEAGPDAFYQGAIAEAVLAAAARGEAEPPLAAGDLAGYQARERAVLCLAYRVYRACGEGPPTSGGVAVLQILGILQGFDLGREPLAPAAVHLLAEASRLAFADRNAYLADPDFVPQPLAELLDPAYLRVRGALIRPDAVLGKAMPGLPDKQGLAAQPLEPPATSHLVVVDRWGEAVTVTASIENAFGARRMATLTGQGGFLLNNELTDFSFRPTDEQGRAVANRVEPGKRPRSSMAPLVLLDGEGRLAFALGSPGGAWIIGYVAEAVVALVDWRLDPAQAVALPHALNRNGPTELEADRGLEGLAAALAALGHEIRFAEMTSGLAIVAVTPEGLRGAADPRREGTVVGD